MWLEGVAGRQALTPAIGYMPLRSVLPRTLTLLSLPGTSPRPAVVIFHGMTVAQWRKAEYHLQPEHAAFAALLQAPQVRERRQGQQQCHVLADSQGLCSVICPESAPGCHNSVQQTMAGPYLAEVHVTGLRAPGWLAGFTSNFWLTPTQT
jgi:hypothetical protein